MIYDGLLFHQLPQEEQDRIIHNCRVSFKEFDEYLNDKIESFDYQTWKYQDLKAKRHPENPDLKAKADRLHEEIINRTKPQGYFKDRFMKYL
jgi:hypothetical protein